MMVVEADLVVLVIHAQHSRTKPEKSVDLELEIGLNRGSNRGSNRELEKKSGPIFSLSLSALSFSFLGTRLGRCVCLSLCGA